jgi:acetyl esterase/lipase
VLLHGGFWRARYTKVLTRRLAHAVVGCGWAACNVEYRRVGRLGGGGGWPETFVDVAAAVDALADQPGLDLTRVVACGHSAGGHLALWLAARPRLDPGTPGSGIRVPLRGVVSLAGIGDLRAAADLDLGAGAVTQFLGGGPDAHPDRYRSASPIEFLPLGVPQVLVHGSADTVVPPSLSEDYIRRAQARGDTDAVYELVPGAGHRDMLQPRSEAWQAARAHLGRLLEG